MGQILPLSLVRENMREFLFHKILTSAFSNLQTLFMGRMDYDWNQCQRNLEFMKNLQVLHIYENPITQIPTECKVHTLVELNLGGCPLKEWGNVMKLSKLPKLQKLVGKINFCEFMDLIFKIFFSHIFFIFQLTDVSLKI